MAGLRAKCGGNAAEPRVCLGGLIAYASFYSFAIA